MNISGDLCVVDFAIGLKKIDVPVHKVPTTIAGSGKGLIYAVMHVQAKRQF